MAYIKETYRRWFVDGQRPGDEPNLSDSLAAVGVGPEETIARARSAEWEAALALETDTAKSLGVFGSPSFRHRRGALLGGDDRLEAALDWETGRQRL